MRKWIVLAAVAAALALGAAASAGAADTPQCAYPVSMTNAGTVVTGTFDVVSPECQLSMVGISYYGGPTTVVDTATQWFDIGRHQLSVTLPCGTHTEADLVLGPPYPLFTPPFGLWNTEYLFDCGGSIGGPSTGPSSGTSGGTTPAPVCTPTPLGCYEHAPHQAYCTPAGAFEDLLLGQATWDPTFANHYPAAYVKGVGLTCNASGYHDTGTKVDSMGLDLGPSDQGRVYEYYT
jgi:hypothetical protein